MTPTLSVADSVVIATVSELDSPGMVKEPTTGASASDGGVEGLLEEAPGKVRALISWRLLKPSPSESSPSIALKLRPALAKAAP